MWFHPSLDGSREVLCGFIDVFLARALELNNRPTFCVMARILALSRPLFSLIEAYVRIKTGRKWGLINQVTINKQSVFINNNQSLRYFSTHKIIIIVCNLLTSRERRSLDSPLYMYFFGFLHNYCDRYANYVPDASQVHQPHPHLLHNS